MTSKEFYAAMAEREAKWIIYHRAKAAEWNSGHTTKSARTKKMLIGWAHSHWKDALRSEDKVILLANYIIGEGK